MIALSLAYATYKIFHKWRHINLLLFLINNTLVASKVKFGVQSFNVLNV